MSMQPSSGLHHIIDVTKFFDENGISFQDSKILHFELESYDENEEPIDDNIYKPTFEYVDKDQTRIIRYHVSYFQEYSSVLEILDNGRFILGEFHFIKLL